MNTVEFTTSHGAKYIIRKAGWFACFFLFALCSCNSSKHASKKRRKMAPCDCPKFTYTLPAGKCYDAYVIHV